MLMIGLSSQVTVMSLAKDSEPQLTKKINSKEWLALLHEVQYSLGSHLAGS